MVRASAYSIQKCVCVYSVCVYSVFRLLQGITLFKKLFTGNHTIAVIKSQESYVLLQQSCSCLLKQVNKLIESKKVTVNGKDIPVEVYLGGDYKVN